MAPVFDSRDENYKHPFGAVTTGTEVFFSIRPPREWAVSNAFLCVSYEFDRANEERPMVWTGLETDRDCYRAMLPTEDRLGPVWYQFRIERFDRPTLYISCPPDGAGTRFEVSETPGRAFQLTVYDAALSVPDWYGRGVTYHIFPDRFYRTEIPDPAGLVGNRTVHRDWTDTPDFLPDENGEIRNRDFFGGSLRGVMKKLPYLKTLGVTTLYFSPVFEAASNHRYDTSDYHRIDPMFGTEAEFSALCTQAEAMGMRVMLDGVFNHTGYDSRYFNGRGTYDGLGAHQSKESPYYAWYDFQEWPFRYSSWWGVYTLPQVNETDPSYMDFIIDGKDSVVRHWLRAGASAWRLDVADELPGEFIARLREAARAEKPDAVIIGEVWEDASHKIAYGVRRRYLLGHELDGVMNYPFRNALLEFMLGGGAERFRDSMETLRENYPADTYYSMMNIVGTHDTPRVLTVLGAEESDYTRPRGERAALALTPEQRALAVRRLKLASLIQFAFPGSPCVYYGDEAGLEGFEDPFNRRGYPWGREDAELVGWYTCLGQLRNGHEALMSGTISYLRAEGPVLAFARTAGKDRVIAAANRGGEPAELVLPWAGQTARDAMTGTEIPVSDGRLAVTLPPVSGMLICEK